MRVPSEAKHFAPIPREVKLRGDRLRPGRDTVYTGCWRVNRNPSGTVAPGVTNLLNDRRVLLPLLLTAVVIAVGSVLIVVFAGEPTGGQAPTASASAPVAGRAVTIAITDFKYKPVTLTVKAGSKVTWINNDGAPHTATAAGDFDTGTLKKGESKTLKLAKQGTYAYICQFHPFMKATVVVR